MQIKDRQRLLTYLAIAAVAVLLGEKVVYTPLVSAWKSRAARITELRRQITQGRTLLDRERILQSRWDHMRRNTLPSNPSAAEQRVYSAVDGWAQDSRVTVTSIVPQWKHEDDGYSTYQCRVDVSGTISSLSKFLYDIEKDPMPLKIESMEVGARDKQGQQLSMAMQFSGLVLNLETK